VIETPRIAQCAPQDLATVVVTQTRSALRHVLGPALAELKAAVAVQRLTCGTAWYLHYLPQTADSTSVEVCVPVRGPVATVGRVRAGHWAGMPVARVTHQGPYDELPRAWAALRAWLRLENRRTAADCWECYLVGPESRQAASQWRTDVVLPLEV
jgi:effector-binding domain-containing protein